MVNPAVRAYMYVSKGRSRVEEASRRVDAAYLSYQQALRTLGPCPLDGRQRYALVAKEDALAHAIEVYRLEVGKVLHDFSLIQLKPPA